MQSEFESRLKKAKEYCTRVFFHEDFKDPRKVKSILKKELTQSSFFKAYEAPLLNAEEELCYFKKMNYLKYKAKRLLEAVEVSEKRLIKVESIIDQAKKIRNLIAESNLRLSMQLLKCNVSYYKKRSLVESLLSDAHFDIIKSVDYFDWTLGNRFSTYATWVVKKNFFRESKEVRKKTKESISIEDSDAKNYLNHDEGCLKGELDYKSQQQMVSSLLLLLETGDCTKDQSRQVFILESYFGLNGKKRCTLEEISSSLGITKERVRQLKEKGIDWLRKKIKHMNLNYEIIFENFRY